MDYVFTGQSALNYYRTPPRYLEQFPEFQEPLNHSEQIRLLQSPPVKLITGLPVNLLSFHANIQHNSSFINRFVVSQELPRGSICESKSLGFVSSPELTLFMLSKELPAGKLALIIYEFISGYTTFMPSRQFKEIFNVSEQLANYSDRDNWKQSVGTNKKPTNLWVREPLTSLQKLEDFADNSVGLHGVQGFRKALRMVAGVVRSPFEAKLATLLFAPRSLGGEGLSVETGKIIRFTKAAKSLSVSEYAEADIYVESHNGEICIDVECQGEAFHAGNIAEARDAERTLAVESMGIEIMPVTYRQISNSRAYEELLAQLYSKLKIKRRPKNSTQHEAEQELRACLFSH